MPLSEFISETMTVLATDDEQVLVERARTRATSQRPRELAVTTEFNDAFHGHG
ncbi:Uncharacterised protein [Mycobacterium tuberculosis]|nr:Uncharacterised protein [Mycobacterium tuberculosis]